MIREASYIDDGEDGVSPRYRLSIKQACMKASLRNTQKAIMLHLLLMGHWDDAIIWAENVINAFEFKKHGRKKRMYRRVE